MKRIKIVILWLIGIGLVGMLLKSIQGISLHLFLIDIKTCFRYASKETYKVMQWLCFFFVVGLITGISWQIAKKRWLIFTWNIRIKKQQYEISSYRFPYRSVLILSCVSVLLMLASMFLRDVGAHRGGKRLETTCVAHALGGIDDKTYTNSREALLLNYDLGHRVFEADFSITSDGEMVCVHDWTHGALIQGRTEAEVLSKTEFEKGIIYGKYTPLSVEELLCFMSEHEDIWVVTDTKETAADLVAFEISYIVNRAKQLGVEPVLNRIAFQIYNPDMYEVVCETYSFSTIIFTMYQYWSGDQEAFLDICRFCAYHDIDILTMQYYLVTPELMEIANQFGIQVYVHTVNEIEVAQELKRLGVSGFYTDYLTPEVLKDN